MSKQLGRVCALLACAMPSAFGGSVLLSGNSFDSSNGTFTGNLAQLAQNAYVFVAPSDFATTAISGFGLVWLDGFSDYASLSSLGPYLAGGGTLLVQNPGFGSNPLSEYPNSAGLLAVFQTSDTVHILAPSDPLNAGLTDGGLSGWGDSAYGYFSPVPGGFTTLSNNGNSGEAITLSARVGAGWLIYTQQGISQYLSSQDFAAISAPLTLIDNVTSVPEPSFGFVFCALAAIVGIRSAGRRRRPA
jgi:hypothetical protein